MGFENLQWYYETANVNVIRTCIFFSDMEKESGACFNKHDGPTGRRILLPSYLSIAEWSDARSDVRRAYWNRSNEITSKRSRFIILL